MTPEQVTKSKGRMIAIFGAAIPCFYMAYQYAQPVLARAEPPPAFAPSLIGGIGLVCLIVAGLTWRKMRNQNVPAATTDLSGPQEKIVILFLVLGVIALAGRYLVGYVVHDENLALALSVGLLVIMIVCFLTAAWIGRNIRKAASTGVVKE